MTATVAEKPQHIEALELARQARTHQTEILRQLGICAISLEHILGDPGMGSVCLERVLRSLPTRSNSSEHHYRRHRMAAQILARSNLPADRRLVTLTDDSRRRLLDAAWDYCGQIAWIFTSDRKPNPPQATHHRGEASREASMKGLALANQARQQDMTIKKALQDGSITLREALEMARVQQWQIGQVVKHLRRTTTDGTKWLTRMSPAAARKELRRARLAPQVKVEALSEGRREDLIARFALARFCRPSELMGEVTR